MVLKSTTSTALSAVVFCKIAAEEPPVERNQPSTGS